MQCKSADTGIYEELASLNAGLLRILVWRDTPEAVRKPRMAPVIADQLRKLTDEELQFIAGTPALLAAFEARNAASHAIRVTDAETNPYVPDRPSPRLDAGHGRPVDHWSRITRLYAATLLTWLWKTDQRDQLVRALCIGCGQELPHLSVPVIESLAVEAAPRLRVRFADHPRFWPDLIVAARSVDSQLRALSRLAVLPLVLAEERIR